MKYKKVANLPKMLKIGYQDITIVPGEFNLDGDLGAYNDEESKIYINTTKPRREILNSLLHEALHAICHNYGLRESMEHKNEEKLVCILANGLTQTLKDNPELLTWLKNNI
jgi:Zn-dependent peptidase ImmA (M78 family)